MRKLFMNPCESFVFHRVFKGLVPSARRRRPVGTPIFGFWPWGPIPSALWEWVLIPCGISQKCLFYKVFEPGRLVAIVYFNRNGLGVRYQVRSLKSCFFCQSSGPGPSQPVE